MDQKNSIPTLHTPLDEQKREIRLIRGLKVDSTGTISCRLSKGSLGQDGHGKSNYITLSYLWGDPKKTEDILVNGRPFAATVNLVSFFRHYIGILPKLCHLPIWIDAICINQADTDERTAQVKLMGDIYRGAFMSISWLGPSSEDSSLAISTISTCAKYIRQDPSEDGVEWLQHEKDLLGTVDFEDPVGGGLPHNKAWAAISQFLRRPYWTRVWIYQEIVLPTEIVMLCGGEKVNVDNLLLFLGWMRKVDLKFNCAHVEQEIFPIVSWSAWLSSTGVARLEKHVSNRKNQHHASGSLARDVNDLAKIYPIGLSATDPRDIVFGMLGALPIPVVPDYKKSVEDVFVEFASYLIAKGQLSSVLSQRSNVEKQKLKDGINSTLQLPSWVPDFSLFGLGALSSQKRFVHADSIDTDPGFGLQALPEALEPRVEKLILRASGVICEHIVQTPSIYTFETAFAQIRKFLPGNERGVEYYPTGIPIHQALIRILLKDPGILRKDDSNQIDTAILLGSAVAVLECMLHPEHSPKELFAHWRSVGFEDGIPTYEELQMLLFDRWIDDRRGVIMYDQDRELYRANRRSAMFQLASWDQEYLFWTEYGYIGLVQGEAKAGDLLCVLFGCREPVILRPVGTGQQYQFVGTCYVLGFMEGEAVQLVRDGKKEVEIFNIH